MSDPKRFFLVAVLMVIGMARFAPAQAVPPAPAPGGAPAPAQAVPAVPAPAVPLAPAQDPGPELAALVARIAEKFAAAKQYVFEGNLNVSRKTGEGPMNSLAKAKIKLAVMPGDKYVLRVENADKTGYVAVSDGQTSWVYSPALKKYTRQEAVAVRTRYDSKESLEDPQAEAGRSWGFRLRFVRERRAEAIRSIAQRVAPRARTQTGWSDAG